MIVDHTIIRGVVELIREPISDRRGLFERVYCEDFLKEHLNGKIIKQINHSLTIEKGAIRGMHLQLGASAEFKIISCISGEVCDFALDLRKNSSTFLRWCNITLSPTKHNSLLIPPGVAHGFQCLEENSELLYFHTESYSPNDEFGVNFRDPKVCIKWPIPPGQISDRDLSFKSLSKDFSGFDL